MFHSFEASDVVVMAMVGVVVIALIFVYRSARQSAPPPDAG